MRAIIFSIIIMMTGLSLSAAGHNFIDAAPAQPNPAKHYLFYLHGAIIERGDLTPEHPRFGLYDMHAIRTALSGAPDTILISAQRPQGTKSPDYAAYVADQVRGLLSAGVPANHITVSGFSKGSGIAIMASSLLQNPGLNFVFMAACNQRLFDNVDIKIYGRVLSLYEESDNIGRSCATLKERSPGVTDYMELQLQTGLMHGTFYLPRDEWVEPLLAWTKAGN